MACANCGSTNVVSEGDFFSCYSCGTSYGTGYSQEPTESEQLPLDVAGQFPGDVPAGGGGISESNDG